MNKYILITSLLLAAMVATSPKAVNAQYYGETTKGETPKEVVVVHKPVEAGLADLLNPLTVGAALTVASAVMYNKARKSTLA